MISICFVENRQKYIKLKIVLDFLVSHVIIVFAHTRYCVLNI